jgi:V8-like Glu-specific endopeptidase
MTGYPGDKAEWTMWTQYGNLIQGVYNTTIFMTSIDSKSGDSGSAIAEDDPDSLALMTVGIERAEHCLAENVDETTRIL